MKLTKENVCVLIEDEAQLQQARELLVKYKQELADDGCFALSKPHNSYANYLQFDITNQDWWLFHARKNKITITKLEKILSDGKETLQRNI